MFRVAVLLTYLHGDVEQRYTSDLVRGRGRQVTQLVLPSSLHTLRNARLDGRLGVRQSSQR